MDDLRKIDELISRAQITVTPEEIQQVKKWLTGFYNDINYNGDIKEKVDTLVEECIIGWERAPKNFYERIKKQVGAFVLSHWRKKKIIYDESIAKGLTEEQAKIEAQKFEDEFYNKKREEVHKYFANKREEKKRNKTIDRETKKKLQSAERYEIEMSDVYGDSIFDFLKPDWLSES